eukprot:NODE_90_length_21577_cov_0.697691.p17 type:complete len:107 gc:universal NODE_90_length_21577_cov_0.697691:9624-9944(+)
MDSKGKACALAALILQDSGIDVTSEGILSILKVAKVEVEPIWANIFSKALDGVDVKELLSNFSSAPAPGGGAPAAGGQGAAPAAEEKKEEEAKEESDDDMGFGLFD